MRIAIIANVPVWILPGLARLRHGRHYATWLEPLIPAWEPELGDFELHWITLSKETREVIELTAFGQSFHILPRGSLGLQMVSGYVGEILRIRKVLARLKPDLVHAWGSEDVCGLAGAFGGVPNRLFTLQGCLTEYVRILGGSALFKLQAGYERFTVRRYSAGTAESPGAAGLLRGLNPEMEVQVVDYGVNPRFFETQWRPAATPEVLFVGSVCERKGIRELIQVAANMARVHFHVAGDGPLRAAMQEQSGSNVHWHGNCGRDEVARLMESSWALVAPTFADTGPTVVKEARVVGLPVITTTAAGAKCYVESHGCGKVIAPGDPVGLEAALAEVCQDRDTCMKMGSLGWPEHREQLASIATARKLMAIYRKMGAGSITVAPDRIDQE